MRKCIFLFYINKLKIERKILTWEEELENVEYAAPDMNTAQHALRTNLNLHGW